jgi:2,5-dihydroxypyridine 5,6-dioxygenase
LPAKPRGSNSKQNTSARTAKKLVGDLLKTREGETVAITCDTESDWDFVVAVEKAAASLGAKPLVVRNQAPPHVGRAAEPYLPLDSLVGVVSESDVWIELNGKWLLYSKVWEEAMKRNRTKYMCLVGMNVDMANRCVGDVDVKKVLEFQRRLQNVTSKSRSMRYTTPGGTDVTFENDPNRPVLVEGDVSGPGEYMLLGQVDWAPLEETINGIIAFDGSVNPPDKLGLLKQPIKLEVKNGRVVRVFGSAGAKIYEKWLKSLNDENMYVMAHVSYGCNPGAKLTGNVLEDERIWGVLEWGLGNQSGTFKARDTRAISHSDGITLSPTLSGDNEFIIKNGEYVHPELLELARALSLKRGRKKV